MNIPDILAMELDESINRCMDAGLETEVIFTQAPGIASHGKLRVLRIQEAANGKIVLTVARE